MIPNPVWSSRPLSSSPSSTFQFSWMCFSRIQSLYCVFIITLIFCNIKINEDGAPCLQKGAQTFHVSCFVFSSAIVTRGTKKSLRLVNTWRQDQDEMHHAQTHKTQILQSVQPELRAGVTIRLQVHPPINSSTDGLLMKADSAALLWEQINGGSSS